MTEYSEGDCCEDGYIILADGKPPAVREILDMLRERDAFEQTYLDVSFAMRKLKQEREELAAQVERLRPLLHDAVDKITEMGRYSSRLANQIEAALYETPAKRDLESGETL